MTSFKVVSDFKPTGDQPQAIKSLTKNILSGIKHQVLLGVTGSGKTFTMANVIANIGRPALVLAPNKTLAAQLYNEFRTLFPENAVEYFVSYYDYYQPEAYLPTTDTYIQKDSSINDLIDKMRHSATRSVLSRRDVIVVASVSCIFGLGAPEDYLDMRLVIDLNMEMSREELLSKLVSMHYSRNDFDFHRGVFRVRGDRVEIYPAYEEDKGIRVEFFGDEVEAISEFDPLKGTFRRKFQNTTIYPASHYVTQKGVIDKAVETIKKELKERVEHFRNEKKLIEAQRIEERTNFDLEMILELGYCNGIENYSRHFTGRAPGQPPPTLLEYFPDDYLLILDESHIGIPQLHGMYKGDRSRKGTLVQYGFRLPSALDNRPLKFEEFYSKISQAVYVSATPADFELKQAQSKMIEQIVRPTGLLDPEIKVKDAKNQVDDLYEEILKVVQRKERVLVTTLTKRMAEDLTDYFSDLGVRVKYLHSDISTLERMDIIRDLRVGTFDVLVGINLLREGLDIPEVSLVAILDADKEGFLRSNRSLIQTCGRAARNVNGNVILYGEKITGSMKHAIDETSRRRKIQKAYNDKHLIVPKTIRKEVSNFFDFEEYNVKEETGKVQEPLSEYESPATLESAIDKLEEEMKAAADALDFEKAAALRDQILIMKKMLLFEF